MPYILYPHTDADGPRQECAPLELYSMWGITSGRSFVSEGMSRHFGYPEVTTDAVHVWQQMPPVQVGLPQTLRLYSEVAQKAVLKRLL